MIPGWPYSVIAALEPGRTSWTAVLDAVRLVPDDDETEVTAVQVRDVVARLIAAGHWRDGDPAIMVVFDAGYDVTRLAWLLADLPVELLGPTAQRPGAATARAGAPARHPGPAAQARRSTLVPPIWTGSPSRPASASPSRSASSRKLASRWSSPCGTRRARIVLNINAFTRLPARVAGNGKRGDTATAKMRPKNTPSV